MAKKRKGGISSRRAKKAFASCKRAGHKPFTKAFGKCYGGKLRKKGRK